MSLPSRVDVLRARRAARFAATRAMPATVCPYRPGSPDDAERVLALAWVREYLRHQPTPETLLDPAEPLPANE